MYTKADLVRAKRVEVVKTVNASFKQKYRESVLDHPTPFTK